MHHGLIAGADTLRSSKCSEHANPKQSICVRRKMRMVLVQHEIRLMVEANDSRAIAHRQWVSQGESFCNVMGVANACAPVIGNTPGRFEQVASFRS